MSPRESLIRLTPDHYLWDGLPETRLVRIKGRWWVYLEGHLVKTTFVAWQEACDELSRHIQYRREERASGVGRFLMDPVK